MPNSGSELQHFSVAYQLNPDFARASKFYTWIDLGYRYAYNYWNKCSTLRDHKQFNEEVKRTTSKVHMLHELM